MRPASRGVTRDTRGKTAEREREREGEREREREREIERERDLFSERND